MFVDEKLTDHFVESGRRIALGIKELLKTVQRDFSEEPSPECSPAVLTAIRNCVMDVYSD